MASNPPARCCTIGVKHEGEAKGQIQTISGISTYVTYPENKNTELAILVLPDVIGHKFINAQLLADNFAANGYFVVMPDIFEGDPVPLNRPEGFDFGTWISKGGPNNGHTVKQVDPIVEAIIKEMKTNMGVKRIGSVGYCFGAKYVARFSVEGKGIDVAAMAHPSFVDAEEIKAMKAPLTIAAAETDEIFPASKRRETEDLLKDMSIPYQITLYSDVVHGFAVRGDVSNKRVKYAKEAAFLQHVQWFDEYLKGKRDSAA
nr:hydrolase tropi [Quercus suber]